MKYNIEIWTHLYVLGTIFAGLDNGKVQVWSHHAMGGYLSEYKAVHSGKDFVISMCTDQKNHYVYTGNNEY